MNSIKIDSTSFTPSKIVCVGRNYAAHAAEGGRDPNGWIEVRVGRDHQGVEARCHQGGGLRGAERRGAVRRGLCAICRVAALHRGGARGEGSQPERRPARPPLRGGPSQTRGVVHLVAVDVLSGSRSAATRRTMAVRLKLAPFGSGLFLRNKNRDQTYREVGAESHGSRKVEIAGLP